HPHAGPRLRARVRRLRAVQRDHGHPDRDRALRPFGRYGRGLSGRIILAQQEPQEALASLAQGRSQLRTTSINFPKLSTTSYFTRFDVISAKNFRAHSILLFSISRNSSDDMLPLVSATKYTCFTSPSRKAMAQSGL